MIANTPIDAVSDYGSLEFHEHPPKEKEYTALNK